MPKENCGNCRFYRDKERGPVKSGYGKCRRYPEPVETSDGGWCGEYKAADLGSEN